MLIAFYGKMIKNFVKPPFCMGSINPLWHGFRSYIKTRGDTFFSFKILKKPKLSKGQLISKADWHAIDFPKKWTDDYILFAFLLFTANKSNSSVCFLGESMVHQSAFRFYLTFSTETNRILYENPDAQVFGTRSTRVSFIMRALCLLSLKRSKKVKEIR